MIIASSAGFKGGLDFRGSSRSNLGNRLGLADDVVTYVPNPRLASQVPATLAAKVDSAEALMLGGKFTARIVPDSVREENSP